MSMKIKHGNKSYGNKNPDLHHPMPCPKYPTRESCKGCLWLSDIKNYLDPISQITDAKGRKTGPCLDRYGKLMTWEEAHGYKGKKHQSWTEEDI